MEEKIEEIYFKNAKEWRAWLKKNHKKEKKVYVIKYKKHTGKDSLSHRDSLHEAICFGWIDTTVKRLDEDRYRRCFVKRNNNCKWSKNTVKYAKELIKKGKMEPEGLKYYKIGLKNTIYRNMPKNLKTPKDLLEKLMKNKKAQENFNNLAPSYKRQYLIWIERAKRPETRQKRIKEVFGNALNNKKLGR